MTWAQRLKRVFKIDVETCEQCGGPVKIIASIEDPAVILHILPHIERRDRQQELAFKPVRGPPPSPAAAR